MTRTGGCLCGAVRVTAELAGPEIQACHCKQCQAWTGGGPLLSVRAKDLTVTGAENTTAFRVSEWGERVFCKICGSTLWWKMQGKPVVFFAVGLLEDQSGLAVQQEIFVDHRPDWLPIWDGATQSTEAQEKAALDAYLKGESP